MKERAEENHQCEKKGRVSGANISMNKKNKE